MGILTGLHGGRSSRGEVFTGGGLHGGVLHGEVFTGGGSSRGGLHGGGSSRGGLHRGQQFLFTLEGLPGVSA